MLQSLLHFSPWRKLKDPTPQVSQTQNCASQIPRTRLPRQRLGRIRRLMAPSQRDERCNFQNRNRFGVSEIQSREDPPVSEFKISIYIYIKDVDSRDQSASTSQLPQNTLEHTIIYLNYKTNGFLGGTLKLYSQSIHEMISYLLETADPRSKSGLPTRTKAKQFLLSPLCHQDTWLESQLCQ